MDHPPLSIGVDGGGTKTELILVDASGRILAQHTTGGCNPSHLGADGARAVLLTALEALLAESKIEPSSRSLSHPKSKIRATRLFMAGSPAAWQEIAGLIHGFGKVETDTDALPVLELATDGEPGLVLHAGTGSFVSARAPDGSLHYAGGLGWRFGDPGSGFDLGRRAIAHALLELQGWSIPSGLGEALQEHTGLVDETAIKRSLYSSPDANAHIAGFSRRVMELVQQGCPPARAVLDASLNDLIAQARLVTDKLFPGATAITCGVSGTILNTPAATAALKALAETHAWRVHYRFITDPPIEGVRRLLVRANP